MTNFLQFAVLGLGLGAIYVLLGDGLVLIYRGSGVLNLAHGAYAMFGAYIFYQVHDVSGAPFFVGYVTAVLAVGALGAITQVLVMRRLRHASPLARLIATLGILSLLTGLATLKYGGNVTDVPSSLPGGVIRIGAIAIPESQLILVGIAVALTVVLDIFGRRSLFGLAMSAVAENEPAAAALGWSPNGVALVTWTVGAGLAATAGVLVVPLSGLSVSGLTLIVVAAMAASLLGGFTSLRMTLLGGIIVGIVQSELSGYAPNVSGLVDATPFLLIMLVLVIRGTPLPARGHVFERLPTVGTGVLRPKAILATLVVLVALIFTVLPQGLTIALTAQAVVAVILLGLVVITGYAGQLALAPYALAGMGAWFAGLLVAESGWPFVPAAVMAVIGSGIVGIVFGLPALRTRGTNLAVVTIGLGLAVYAMVFNSATLTGGVTGLTVGSPTIFGLSVDPIQYPDRYATMCIGIFALASIAVANLRRGRVGRRWLAVRSNERAAASLGISVTGAKLSAFAFSSAIAGLGGILLGFETPTIVFSVYDPITSMNAVTWITVGGIGSVLGPVLGSGFAPGGIGSYILDKFGVLDAWLPIIAGVSVLGVLIQNPDGVIAGMRDGRGDPLTRYIIRKLRRPGLPRVTPISRPEQELARPTEVSTRRAKLEVSGLTVRYGGVVAVADVSLEVKPGELVALVGPNGAGKTTVIDAVTGFVTPQNGTVRLGGRDLSKMSAQRRCGEGVTRSFQAVELFEDLSVRENLLVAEDRRDRLAYLTTLVRPGLSALSDVAEATVQTFGISDLLDLRPSVLSYAQRRIVGIARAVATRPSVLLLDEPAAGLSEAETAELGALIRRLARELGIGLLLVEHDMSLVMSTCDRVVVLDFGRKIADDVPSKVQRDARVITAFLGEAVGAGEVPLDAPERVGN